MNTYYAENLSDEGVREAFLTAAEWGIIEPPADDAPEIPVVYADDFDFEPTDPREGLTVDDLWTKAELDEMADRMADREEQYRDSLWD